MHDVCVHGCHRAWTSVWHVESLLAVLWVHGLIRKLLLTIENGQNMICWHHPLFVWHLDDIDHNDHWSWTTFWWFQSTWLVPQNLHCGSEGCTESILLWNGELWSVPVTGLCQPANAMQRSVTYKCQPHPSSWASYQVDRCCWKNLCPWNAFLEDAQTIDNLVSKVGVDVFWFVFLT